MTGRRAWLLASAMLGVLLVIVAAIAPWQAVLHFNPSDSAARGWYLLRPADTLQPGMHVFARLPSDVAQFAHARGYLPSHLPLLKRIAAVGGQHVCEREGKVFIDAYVVGTVRTTDGLGRPLRAWAGCRVLESDEVFLLAANHPDSFDARYFGPVAQEAVLGEAVALWTW